MSAANATAAVPPPATSTIAEDPIKKVVVFGGSGFVGTRVCSAALKLGCDVVSISRKGRPDDGPGAVVTWVKGDVFKPEMWREELKGATGVVACIGAFGNDAFMEKICGDTNIIAAEEAEKAGVKNFVFISAAGVGHENHMLLKGYWKGKRKAEGEVLKRFPTTGVVLRPPAIYGARKVGPVTVPLGVFMRPMEMVLQLPPFGQLRKFGPFEPVFTPPVAVEAVGKAAAAAAVGMAPAGIQNFEGIKELAKLVV